MFWHHDDPEFDNPPGNNVQGIPLQPDYEIVRCVHCLQPWDDWHEQRKGKLYWLPCKWRKRLGF